MALGASHRLQDGVLAVETMTRFALAVLALASGVYTYLGVRSLLDGSPTAVFFAVILSPIRRICSAVGPMKVMPCASRMSANLAFSDRKP